MGGAIFSINALWAQVFPFVTLALYKKEIEGNDDIKEALTKFLLISLISWFVLTVIFLVKIDISYLGTFFSRVTGPAYVAERAKRRAAKRKRSENYCYLCFVTPRWSLIVLLSLSWLTLFTTNNRYTGRLFLLADDDYSKFDAVFKNNLRYTKELHDDVKEWLADNVARFSGKPCFRPHLDPKSFLPHGTELLGQSIKDQQRVFNIILSEKNVAMGGYANGFDRETDERTLNDWNGAVRLVP